MPKRKACTVPKRSVVRFCIDAGTISREAKRAQMAGPDQIKNALSGARTGISCFSVDK